MRCDNEDTLQGDPFSVMALIALNVIFIQLVLSIALLQCAYGFDAYKDVYFELYTREEPHNYHLLNPLNGEEILKTTFNTSRPTRIFVHGYRSKRKVIERYAEGFLQVGDFNFIAVNWQEGSSTVNYYSAKSRVKKVCSCVSSINSIRYTYFTPSFQQVSEVLAKLIDFLANNGMNIKDLVLIGHSLGAHTVGRAAKQITSGRIPVIIGLDPASVFFDFEKTDKRLADTDADYVQVIHTDSGHYSIEYPIGHADFYPNGGRKQPGCPLRNYFTNLVGKLS